MKIDLYHVSFRPDLSELKPHTPQVWNRDIRPNGIYLTTKLYYKMWAIILNNPMGTKKQYLYRVRLEAATNVGFRYWNEPPIHNLQNTIEQTRDAVLSWVPPRLQVMTLKKAVSIINKGLEESDDSTPEIVVCCFESIPIAEYLGEIKF